MIKTIQRVRLAMLKKTLDLQSYNVLQVWHRKLPNLKASESSAVSWPSTSQPGGL